MSLCNISITGNLTRDAEATTIGANNIPVTKLGVAVNVGFGDKKTVMFFNVSYFRKPTGINDYLKSGTKVSVSGEFMCREYKDNSGVMKQSLDINASFLGLEGGKDEGQSGNNQRAPAQSQQDPAQATTPVAQTQQQSASAEIDDDF